MSEPQLALAKPADLFEVFQAKWFRDKLTAAIPNTIKPDRMIQLALTMIKGSASLMRCSPISLMACVVECAQLGLELDKILGHAYIVPFKGEATLIVGYRGFCHLMYQSGVITSISAEVVRPKDHFEYQLGTKRGLIHRPAAIPAKDDPDNWRGAYAVAHTITGLTEFEFMEAQKIITTRNRSRSWQAWLSDKKSTPWQTDTEEMWRKTPIRRLAKRMPVSTTDKREILLRAVMVDEYAERPGLLKPTEEGFVVAEEAVAEPIEPTLEKQLQDSIDVVNAKKDKPGREKKKPPKKAEGGFEPGVKVAGPPKANIPPPTKINDPFLTITQQTQLYHTAAQAGWKVPEEVIAYLKKKFDCKGPGSLRNSQFKEVLEKVQSGT